MVPNYKFSLDFTLTEMQVHHITLRHLLESKLVVQDVLDLLTKWENNPEEYKRMIHSEVLKRGLSVADKDNRMTTVRKRVHDLAKGIVNNDR